jgi:hypothetical protein
MLGALQSAFREPAFLRQGGDALTLPHLVKHSKNASPDVLVMGASFLQ